MEEREGDRKGDRKDYRHGLPAGAGPRLSELQELQATGSGRGYDLVGGIVDMVGPVLLASVALR